jgi:hypothetical protein
MSGAFYLIILCQEVVWPLSLMMALANTFRLRKVSDRVIHYHP